MQRSARLFPFIGQVNIGGSVRLRCLFDKYEFEFECDPALALVRVLRIAYHRVVDRRSTLADNPSLQAFRFYTPEIFSLELTALRGQGGVQVQIAAGRLSDER